MTLSFSEKFPDGTLTLFKAKIWKSIFIDLTSESIYIQYQNYHIDKFKKAMFSSSLLSKIQPKKHTIRKDENKRWKSGMDIHAVINNRTKNRFQFAPVFKCKSVQEIVIEYYDDGDCVEIKINNKSLYDNGRTDSIWSTDDLDKFCQNDGFNNSDDFFEWFDEDFKGRIIHWTDLAY